MSISLDVQDLENFPGVTKKVTLDTTILVPSGFEGDEKYLISAQIYNNFSLYLQV